MRAAAVVVFLLLLQALLPGDAGATPPPWVLRHDAPRFSLAVPGGFRPYTAEEPAPGLVACLRRASEGGGTTPLVLLVVRLGGELPQRPLTSRELQALRVSDPLTFRDHRETATVLGFEVDQLAGRAEGIGGPVLRLAAGVPLSGEGVVLTLLAPATREREARATFRTVLASVRGASPWRTAAQRTLSAVARGLGALALLLSVGYLVASRTVPRWRDRWRRARVATLLVAAAGWLLLGAWFALPLGGRQVFAAVQSAALGILVGVLGLRALRAGTRPGAPG